VCIANYSPIPAQVLWECGGSSATLNFRTATVRHLLHNFSLVKFQTIPFQDPPIQPFQRVDDRPTSLFPLSLAGKICFGSLS